MPAAASGTTVEDIKDRVYSSNIHSQSYPSLTCPNLHSLPTGCLLSWLSQDSEHDFLWAILPTSSFSASIGQTLPSRTH